MDMDLVDEKFRNLGCSPQIWELFLINLGFIGNILID